MQVCEHCGNSPATERIYTDNESNGLDHLNLCMECKKIFFLLMKQKEDFVINHQKCEVSGKVEYLHDQQSRHKVRLFTRTYDGVLDAIDRFRQEVNEGKLSKVLV